MVSKNKNVHKCLYCIRVPFFIDWYNALSLPDSMFGKHNGGLEPLELPFVIIVVSNSEHTKRRGR